MIHNHKEEERRRRRQRRRRTIIIIILISLSQRLCAMIERPPLRGARWNCHSPLTSLTWLASCQPVEFKCRTLVISTPKALLNKLLPSLSSELSWRSLLHHSAHRTQYTTCIRSCRAEQISTRRRGDLPATIDKGKRWLATNDVIISSNL